jgi:hypothetical protein
VIKLALPLDKLHLFDVESGEALTTDRAAANVTAEQAAEQEAAPASA